MQARSLTHRPLPAIVGHRGVTESAPENTLAALYQAAREGATWVEFDVQLDRDGQPVVIHDGTLTRVSGDVRKLADVGRNELAVIDVGSWFDPYYSDQRPVDLATYLGHCVQLGMGVNIEIKSDSASAAETALASWPTIATCVAQLPLLVSAFDFSALETLRSKSRSLDLGALFEGIPADWKQQVGDFAPTSIHCWYKVLTDENIADVADWGLQLMVYSVDNTGAARSLWRRGVRSFCTGAPAAIAAALDAERL